MTDQLRRIDALIGTHVMGLQDVRLGRLIIGFGIKEMSDWIHGEGLDYCNSGRDVPPYSTDIALAIGVLEKLKHDRQWDWSIWNHGGDCYGVCIDTSGENWIEMEYGMNLPHAICYHVLSVLGVQTKDPQGEGA